MPVPHSTPAVSVMPVPCPSPKIVPAVCEPWPSGSVLAAGAPV
jgi:hypothetical protein